MKRLEHARILMYSHDTFGLGHLRRCRAVAHALVERFKGLHVLIISGSPIAGAFDFRARVDFVKIPSVIKLYNGEYTSIARHIDIQETLQMRQAIIRHTAQTFDPDLFIVDKEPLGLRGELEDTLYFLKARRCTLVLGLRDVMDSPELLQKEWRPRDMLRRIECFYDEIWVYGTPDFWDPLCGFEVSRSLRARMIFTGYLERTLPGSSSHGPASLPSDYILVTAGGGGDGAALMDQVLSAYECDPALPHPVVLVLGPFMPIEQRDRIRARAEALGKVAVIEFDNRMEALMAGARAVVGMGGYNTFCEVLSFDKPTLIVPRTQPREEQLIRARRAAELGVIDMLDSGAADEPPAMAQALRALPGRTRPSQAGYRILLNGLETIGGRVDRLLAARSWPQLRVLEGGA